MPVWAWICIGIGGAAVLAGLGVVALLLWPDRRRERVLKEGQTVTAFVMLATPNLYDAEDSSAFGFAQVLFTLQNDPLTPHIEWLASLANQLMQCQPNREADADEQTILRAVSSQTTIGLIPRRIPNRLTGGQNAYFATPTIQRRLLPDGALSRDYIYLKVIPEGEDRGVAFIEDPPRSRQ